MELDAKKLNLIAHTLGRAVFELRLKDEVITKTNIISQLEYLQENNDSILSSDVFNAAEEIIRCGSMVDITFID